MHADRFVGRHTMMNSLDDAFCKFKPITFVMESLSTITTQNIVNFTISEFEDGFVGDHHEYKIVLEAVSNVNRNIPP